jgi:sensor histidine kinase YesM
MSRYPIKTIAMFLKKPVFVILVLLALVPGMNRPLYSSDKIEIDDINDLLSLVPYIEVLEDKNGEYTIDDVRAGRLSEKFSRMDLKKLNFVYSSSAFWIRFKLKNDFYIDRDLYLSVGFPVINEASLYIFDPMGIYFEKELNLSEPFGRRDVDYRSFIFNLDIKEPSTYSCYLRLRSEYSIVIAPALMWASHFHRVARLENIFYGILAGLLLLIMFYSAVQFYYLKDLDYIYFVLYLIGFGFFEITFTGLGFEYIWSKYPGLNSIFQSFFIYFSTVWGGLFVNRFLQVNKSIPFLGRIFHILAFLSLLLAGVSLFYYKQVMILFGSLIVLATVFCIIISSLLLWIRESKTAKYFFTGTLFLLAGIILFHLRNFGLIPNNFFTDHGLELGSIFMITTISIAFSERYNMIRTEHLKVQEQLLDTHRSAVKFLEKVDRIKTDFLVNSSKDIRTPVEDIIKITGCFEKDPADILSTDSRSKIQMISTMGRNLLNQIDEIINYSTMRVSDIRLHRKSIDLKELSTMIIFFSRAQITERDIVFVNEIPDDLPPVYGDENRLMQVFFNLIDNALKYTESGRIILSAELQDEQVLVMITDRETDIPEEELVKIFEDYHHTDNLPIQVVDGRGFDIAVTRKLVELHGGTLKVESGKSMGTTFMFSCPLYSELEAGYTVLDAEGESPSMETGLVASTDHAIDKGLSGFDPDSAMNDNYTILVVDDEPVNVQVLVNHLSLVGYNVITASDGYRAIEIVESRDKPDLVLLDIMLPLISGYEVCRKLREKHSLYSLPVIMLTVKNQVKDMVAGFEAGANDYLTKPFDKMELLARVATLLTLRRIVFRYEELRFRELQKRMNPHFLFNALHSIHSLLASKPELADKGVIMLADIYRFLMDRSFEKNIPLEMEWKFVENYLEMEKLRFPDTLSYDMEKRGDFQDVSIPPLIIQPLVENSIKHGIRNMTGPGYISVNAERSNDRISITIKDNGVGLKNSDLYSRTVGNIRNRLQYYFSESGLTLENGHEKGAEANIYFKLGT